MFQLLYHDVVREDFTKKSHLIACFRRFTNAPNHLAVYVRMGKLILEKILKVANIDIGFSVCYINEEK